jgi:hypothetical protein
VGEALAADEKPGFEPIDQARDVRGPRDEPGGKDERGERFGGCIAEEAESVVLLGREIELGKHPFFERLEAIVGAPEVEIGLLLEGVETPRQGGFPVSGAAACGGLHLRHIAMIVVST